MTRYIDEQRGSFGVEPICRTLAVVPSSPYGARSWPILRVMCSISRTTTRDIPAHIRLSSGHVGRATVESARSAQAGSTRGVAAKGPLVGLRVLELTNMIAAPLAGRLLAHGTA